MRSVRLALILAVVAGWAGIAEAADYVRGYVRRDGTYVAPHYRSSRDGYFYNNWSTYGNVNPYTGAIGTKLYPGQPYTPSYNYQPTYTYPSYGSYPSYGYRPVDPTGGLYYVPQRSWGGF